MIIFIYSPIILSLQFKFITLEVQEDKEFYIDVLDLAFNILAAGKAELVTCIQVQCSTKQ